MRLELPRRLVALPLLATLLLFGAACRPPAPSPTPPPGFVPNVKPESKGVKGAAFNKLFPKVSGNEKLTYAQEKQGVALADLTRGGKKVAQLTISDTQTNPEARQKYQSSTKKIAGYPAASVGSQGTAILVGDRYQVQVRSTDPSFTAADREAMIGKFDLSGLASL